LYDIETNRTTVLVLVRSRGSILLLAPFAEIVRQPKPPSIDRSAPRTHTG
jgi:hypothetical protein